MENDLLRRRGSAVGTAIGLAALFVATQFVVSFALMLVLYRLPDMEVPATILAPEQTLLINTVAMAAAAGLVILVYRLLQGRLSLFRLQDVSRLAPYALPVLLLTIGLQLVETGTLAGLQVDPGAYMELVEAIVQVDLALAALAVVIAPSVLEEVVFRRVIQSRLHGALPVPAAIALSALLFSLVHVIPVQMIAAAIFGLGFGYLFWATGSIVPAILAHALTNSFALFAARAQYGPAASEAAPPTAGAVLTLLALGLMLAGAGFFLTERIRSGPTAQKTACNRRPTS